jgi:diphthamide synthase (EF-2-diphthine--ammonia ligase)
MKSISGLPRKKLTPSAYGGEYHTLVVDCPIYKEKNCSRKSQNGMKNTKGYYIIKKANPPIQKLVDLVCQDF